MQLVKVTPVLFGTPFNSSCEILSNENYARLSQVASWGYGKLQAVAFAPDNQTFAAGSPYGLAIFNRSQPERPFQWHPFKEPINYEAIFFSQDGSHVLLEYWDEQYVFSFPDLNAVHNTDQISWVRNSTTTREWGRVELESPSGMLKFKSYVINDEEWFDLEYSIREIFDTESRELKFQLKDETIHVLYSDYNDPEGCDLRSFSYCGNAYAPSANLPFQLAFSPEETHLAILYRPPNLWYSEKYGILRLYDLVNGNLIQSFGSFDDPVTSFAYSPDNRELLIGYMKGSIHIWNLQNRNVIFNAWPLRSYLTSVTYNWDGKFLIVQHDNNIEIHRTHDGAIVSRYEANAYAISPVANLIALGTSNGQIRLHEIDTGKQLISIDAHDAVIYSLAFSPDGNILASSSEDCYLKTWNPKTGESSAIWRLTGPMHIRRPTQIPAYSSIQWSFYQVQIKSSAPAVGDAWPVGIKILAQPNS